MASFGIYNYHRGIEWQWFNASFVRGELLHGDVEHAYQFYSSTLLDGALHEGGIGGLSELYDEHGQLGADFQAWSMAALIESMHRYAGITVDAHARTIRIAPWIPTDWPYLRVRRRVNDLRFDVCYEPAPPSAHHLHLHPLTPVEKGYTVTVGVRVEEGSDIQSAVLNDRPVAAGDWTFDEIQPEATWRRAWLTVPLSGDIDLQVTST